jgi:hypothetical protein
VPWFGLRASCCWEGKEEGTVLGLRRERDLFTARASMGSVRAGVMFGGDGRDREGTELAMVGAV